MSQRKKFTMVWLLTVFNPLYLGITRANVYIEDKGINKYFIFNSTDENKELLKNYNVFNGIKKKY